MDAIDTFLDAMFAPYPTTPRLLEAKGELRTMMEDAYNDAINKGKTHNEAVGQVITDFGNLEELAPTLGILPDLRSAQDGQADSGAAASQTAPAPTPSVYPVVTLPEAQQFAEARRQTGRLLGWGVALCVIAPAPMIIGAGLSGAIDGSRDSWAPLIGFLLNLGLFAAGALILLWRRRFFANFKHLTDGRFMQNPVVSSWAARLRADHESSRSHALMIAIGLWILAAVPVVVAGILSELTDQNLYMVLGVVSNIALIAAGLCIVLPASWASSAHETLTAGGLPVGAGPGWRSPNNFAGAIAPIYWPVVTMIFLAWGFLADGWTICWIVLPIAAVLFAGLSGIVSMLSPGGHTRS